MAKQLATPLFLFLLFFFTSSFLPIFTHAQSNNTFVEQSAFSTFELFKNTGFLPCPINTSVPTTSSSTPKKVITPRDPRGGGRGGGGGGGGGSYTTGGGSGGGKFIETTWVSDQTGFCKRIKGTPVMIPSVPTQYAFAPWWPTYTAQLVSLAFTWVGLWWTARTVERDGAVGTKIPVLFWVQVPVDAARMVMWFVGVVRRFADKSRFSWASVMLWLIPFNYIWLARLVNAKKSSPSNISYQQTPQTYPYGHNADLNKPYMQSNVQEAGLQSPPSPTQGKTKWFFISLLFAFITGLMWLLSLITVGLHFKYSWFDKTSHPVYVETAKALADPSAIAMKIPDGCLTWLKNNATTVARQLLDLRVLQILHVLIAAVQLVLCTIIVVFKNGGQHHILRKLKVSAIAIFVALGLPAIGTGFWILGTVTYGSQDELMGYTNNLNTTSGCTFAAVAMGRQWGYWDVEYERGYRVAMSLLGAA